MCGFLFGAQNLDISRSLGNDHLSVLAMTSVGMLRERQ